jgi:hypothetical protein
LAILSDLQSSRLLISQNIWFLAWPLLQVLRSCQSRLGRLWPQLLSIARVPGHEREEFDVKAAGSVGLACALMFGLAMLAGCNGDDSSGANPTGQATSANSAKLTWMAPSVDTDGNPITGLAGYRIYYGTNESALDQVIEISNPGITTYVLEGLAPGTWYFAIKAYTTGGVESALSNVAKGTIG